jgi:N-acetylmuramoyl-L-alanine amidase
MSTPSPNTPPLQTKSPKGMVIVLDAGHGGSDPGAQRGDISEKDITLGITQKLKKLLEKQGADVTMTRGDDTFVSLEDRVKLTNQIVPDLFVSVHINALESTADIHGIETYYQTEQSKPLAEAIHQSLVSELSAPDRGVRKARFYVINHTTVPAILAEVGFISNKDERQRLTTADYQDKVAEGLAKGVGTWVAKGPSARGTDVAQSPGGSTFSATAKVKSNDQATSGRDSKSAKGNTNKGLTAAGARAVQ